MNREICLIICFLVGVLLFYLLRSSCGCGDVVEGMFDCPAGQEWVLFDWGCINKKDHACTGNTRPGEDCTPS